MYSDKKQHYGFQVSLNPIYQVYHIVFMVCKPFLRNLCHTGGHGEPSPHVRGKLPD